MRKMLLPLLLLSVPSTALADSADQSDDWLTPQGAQSASLTTTGAGLGLAAYYWFRADGLQDGHGRTESKLMGFALATAALSVGPSMGQLLAGASRRGGASSVGRLALLVGGSATVIVGALTTMGCTDSCSGNDQLAGLVIAGLGGTVAAAGVGWAVYDLWTTPAVVRRAREQRPSRATLVPFLAPGGGGVVLTVVR